MTYTRPDLAMIGTAEISRLLQLGAHNTSPALAAAVHLLMHTQAVSHDTFPGLLQWGRAPHGPAPEALFVKDWFELDRLTSDADERVLISVARWYAISEEVRVGIRWLAGADKRMARLVAEALIIAAGHHDDLEVTG